VQPASTGCLSQDAITATASPPGDPTDEAIRKKLEAPLRQLYGDLMGAARRTGLNATPVAPDATAESGAPSPPTSLTCRSTFGTAALFRQEVACNGKRKSISYVTQIELDAQRPIRQTPA